MVSQLFNMEANSTVPDYSREWEQIHCAFLIVIVTTALFGNGFICTSVYCNRRLRKVSYYFLVSLAASDILFVIFSLPFRIYFELNSGWLLGKQTCQFWIFVDLLCTSASIVSLSLISVDRYVALSRPLRYLVIMTVRRCVFSITAVWLFCFIISLLSVHTWSKDATFIHSPQCLKLDKVYYTVASILAILIPLIILLVLYFLVFKMAFEQSKKIHRGAYNNSPRPEESILNIASSLSRHSVSKRRQTSAIRELKATKTLIIVVGTFLLCWLPFCVLLLMQQHSPKYISSLSSKTQEIIGQLFLHTLPALNSAVNPFIYTFFNSEFRKVFRNTFEKPLTFLRSKLRNSSASHRHRPSHPSSLTKVWRDLNGYERKEFFNSEFRKVFKVKDTLGTLENRSFFADQNWATVLSHIDKDTDPR